MPGQRDSGHLAVPSDIRTLSRAMFSCEVGTNLRANHSKGVHASQRLNLLWVWEGSRATYAMVRTGLGKADRPGSQGAPGKRDLWRK
jgi:hypothetical protein